MDTSDIGQYGTLRLVKRLDSQSVVASFPIDEDSLTFGRDPTCSVRLYYPTVSAVHAKIFFEERKAFLVVLGTNGLLIDGCQVFPSPAASPGSATFKHNTIPLSNNSEIEIHKKRFVFTYPPKDLRKPLPFVSTPTRPSSSSSNGGDATVGGTARRTRTLRLSMIQSAQVFTPRPSADPAANLRVLQSPLKPHSRTRPVSPEKKTLAERLAEAREDLDNEGDDDEEIVLVDGNHPRVLEEEKDLVILEDVDVPQTEPRSLISSFPSIPAFSPSKPRPQLKLSPAKPLVPPVTPRRATSRPSLHKAVLIRSAQRAVMRAEGEREGGGVGSRGGLGYVYEDDDDDVEEEEDHMDVDVVEEDDEEKEAAEVAASVAERSFSSGSGSGAENEDEDEEDALKNDEEDEEESGARLQKSPSLWRKSFEKLTWPFRAASREVEEQEAKDANQDASNVPVDAYSSSDDGEEQMDEEVSEHEHLEDGEEADETPATLPIPATPQRTVHRALGNFMPPQPFAAASKGHGFTSGRYSVGGPGARGMGTGPRRVKVEPAWKVKDIVLPLRADDAETVGRVDVEEDAGEEEGVIMMTPARKVKLSDEERKAIQDRRRSALTAPDTFFGGQAPGIGARAGRMSMSPTKNAAYTSPQKAQLQSQGGEEEDTRVLLERMKETVEGMKRRRSVAPATGIFGLGDAPVESEETQAQEDHDAEMEQEQEQDPYEQEQDEQEEEASSDEEVGEGEESDKENAAGDAMPLDAEGEHEYSVASSSRTPVRSTTTSSTATKTPHLDLKHIFAQPPKTPSFKGVRELFKDNAAAPQTPHMDGMRHLFSDRQVPATPSFEGVGEMMSTPSGWRTTDVKEEEPEVDEEIPEEELEEVKPARRARNKPASSSSIAKPPSSSSMPGGTIIPATRRRAPRAAAIKTPVTEGRSNFADDEATPGDLARVQEEDDDDTGKKPAVKTEEMTAEKGRGKARLVRGSKKAVQDIPEEPVEQPKVVRSRTTRAIESEEVKGPPARKTRAPAVKTIIPPSDSEDTSSKPVRRTVKAATKPESGASANEDRTPPPVPVKTTRKPTTRTLKAAVSESEPEPIKKTTVIRKGRTATKTTDDESQSADVGTGKKPTRTKSSARVEDPNDDPLDSIDVPEELVPAPPARRAARSRTTTAEVAAIAQESDTKSGTASRKVPAKKVATKAAPAKKVVPVPSPTPVPAESEEGVDKENTPSMDDEDAVKAKRVVRTRKVTKPADEMDVEVEPPKARTTRATRSRQ